MSSKFLSIISISNLTILSVALFIIIFLAGLYFCLNYSTKNMYEGFDNNTSCPNLLIKQGNELILKNTKLAEIPGVNP